MTTSKPLLVAIGGLVASGKSTVARALAVRLGAEHIEADRVRDVLLELAGGEAVHEAAWHGLAPGFAAAVYTELRRRAEASLRAGRSVVLDACFARAGERLQARALARRMRADFLFVECHASAETIVLRLAERDARLERPGWQALHDDLAARWEPVVELGAGEHVVVQGDALVAAAVSIVEARLHGAREARAAAAPAPGEPVRAPRPAAVTFDCWNTLLFERDWESAHALRVAELQSAAREAGRHPSREEAGRAFDAAWERHMRCWREGRATGARDVAHWGLAELGLDDPHPALEHLVRAFEQASHTGQVLALEGAHETLTALTAAGVPCALVCDTGLTPGRVVRQHLERLGLLDHLAVQIFSDEIGVPKPDPRAFRAALEPLGVSPERALHVGDLRRTDVAGARALGMGSVRILDRHDDASDLPDADFVVRSHGELRELLTGAGVTRLGARAS